MKILLIITDYGSFNNFLSEVAIQLVEDGHQVDVICSPQKVINFPDKFNYTELGILFHFIEFPRSYNPISQIKISREINKLISEIDPQVINIHFTTGIFTTVLWRKPKKFTIGTIHGIGYPVVTNSIKKFIFKAVEKFCFSRLDWIYVLNRSDYQLVNSIYPNKAKIYSSLGVGCNLDQFNFERYNDVDKNEIKKVLGLRVDDFILTFTGRFVSFKGFDIVVKALLSLINDLKLQNIKLLLIGGEDNAHATGLTEEEEFLYKNSPEIIKVGFTNQVDKFLSVTDVFVFPSIKEGMPVCIMEALAMGVPVLTSDTRGCNELVKNGLNGMVLGEKPTVIETIEAILKLYTDRSLLKDLSKYAIAERSLLDRHIYVNQQINIYKEALSVASYS